MSLNRISSLTLILVSLGAVAAEAPLDVSASFDMSRPRASGGTFFELMSNKQSGIKAALDKDYVQAVKIVDAKTFREKASNFSHIADLERDLVGGSKGLDKAVAKLAGREIPVDKMYGTVINTLKTNGLFATQNPQRQSRLAGALVPIIGIASGKGVLVQLDSETYVYNYGYAKGSGGTDAEKDKEERRTGRSYGASAARGAYDPSDNDYLRELGVYMAKASDSEAEAFYTTVFEILVKSDTSGIKSLSEEGQTVMADFMAIYMAELDRHLMTGLKMYEWENALTEITMLAAYSTSDEGMTLDPRGGASNEAERGLAKSEELQPKDRLTGYFGVGTDGSGLDGRNKQRRHSLTKKIVAEQSRLNPSAVRALERLIGARQGVDVYDETMETINNFATQAKVKANADALIKAVVSFVMTTRSSASKMNIE